MVRPIIIETNDPGNEVANDVSTLHPLLDSSCECVIGDFYLDCIVEHSGFDAVCLNTEVLWTSLVNLADREGTSLPPSRDDVENR